MKRCKLCGDKMLEYEYYKFGEEWLYKEGYCSEMCKKTDKMIANTDVMENGRKVELNS